MDSKTQASYDQWENDRIRRGLLKGQRWLTTDDVWQKGDEYMGHEPDWWAIDGPHASRPIGSPIPIGMLCYTPRGSIKRA